MATTVNSDLGGWQPVYIRITGICKWPAGPFPPSFLLPECPSCSILDLTCGLTVPLLWRAGEAEEGLLGLPLVIVGVTGAHTVAQTQQTYDPTLCRTAWVAGKWIITRENVVSFSMLSMIRLFLCLHFLVLLLLLCLYFQLLPSIFCWWNLKVVPPFTSRVKLL